MRAGEGSIAQLLEILRTVYNNIFRLARARLRFAVALSYVDIQLFKILDASSRLSCAALVSRQVEVQNPPKPYFTDYALLVNQILSITLAVFSVERLKSPTLRHNVSSEAFHNHPNSPTHNPYR